MQSFDNGQNHNTLRIDFSMFVRGTYIVDFPYKRLLRTFQTLYRSLVIWKSNTFLKSVHRPDDLIVFLYIEIGNGYCWKYALTLRMDLLQSTD